MRFPSIYYTNRPSKQECSPSGPESNLQTWYKQFLMTWQHCFKAHCAAAFTSLRCRSLYLSYRCRRALSGANCAMRLAELRDTESYKEKKKFDGLVVLLSHCIKTSIGRRSDLLPSMWVSATMQSSQALPAHNVQSYTIFVLFNDFITFVDFNFVENVQRKLIF